MGFLPGKKKRAGNAPVNVHDEPVLGALPEGQGGYSPAPYHHPYTGNLVRHPGGLLNPVFNAFSSFALGFQRPWTPFHRGVVATPHAQQIALANGFALPSDNLKLTPLANFASSGPAEE